MPPSKRKLKDSEDWCLEYFEFIWCSILNRDSESFYKLTPRKLFSQISQYAKYNSPSDSKDKKDKEVVYLNQGCSIGRN